VGFSLETGWGLWAFRGVFLFIGGGGGERPGFI
jgi:hypothetical protein